MGDVVVLEATQHMDDGVGVTDVRKELITQTLALRCALHEAGDVDDLDGCWHNALRVVNFNELVEALVGYGDDAHIRFDGAEREVCCLSACIRQTVEECRLTYIR